MVFVTHERRWYETLGLDLVYGYVYKDQILARTQGAWLLLVSEWQDMVVLMPGYKILKTATSLHRKFVLSLPYDNPTLCAPATNVVLYPLAEHEILEVSGVVRSYFIDGLLQPVHRGWLETSI
jgi:hypothetical protein